VPNVGAYTREQLKDLTLTQIRVLREQSPKAEEATRMPPLVPQERGSTLPLICTRAYGSLDELGLVGSAYVMPFALRLKGS